LPSQFYSLITEKTWISADADVFYNLFIFVKSQELNKMLALSKLFFLSFYLFIDWTFSGVIIFGMTTKGHSALALCC
jgi:hypothetical protein